MTTMTDADWFDHLAACRDGVEPERLLARATPTVRGILARRLDGAEISRDEGEILFGSDGDDLKAVVAAADRIRRERVGDTVSFVVTRNINFTNVCYMGCRFCGFAKRREEAGAELLSMDEIAHRAEVAKARGATEVCIQGGLHPDLSADHYLDILRAIRTRVPDMHVHAFSPFEIWYGAKKRRQAPADYLRELKAAGLGSIPGTAAEILDTEVRRQLTRNKLSAEAWVEIVRAAHGVGLRSTSTMMYGHVDGPRHWAAHLDLLRAIQKQTGGFTEFVPLGFVHNEAPLYMEREIPGVRAGATLVEHLKVHAIARLMLAGWIDNIQVSWVKLGPQAGQALLAAGANDFGGTLMDESISRSAGASFGEEITAAEMVRIIRDAGRQPERRSTLYVPLEHYADHDPVALPPLKARAYDPVQFLQRPARPAVSAGKESVHA
ncbi:5-amino-6-(D-ribitylamino)uracil--L-tyrosine 4-hydroxyphenyl transferase CofH [Paraburkholderia antibiotica]|uniref:FO synthase n=1 Tax=Paraburkholderia antibiotica TaxID=2728839 RepID=A0A7X9X6L9_9BURK|nr:5-amino-6-(D-ribitylamino)uracil--L-tyrosine 4-hydroxyphenyl transferase CofH [Paraburkholderia antibiotica]NML32355.1 5-amino-6-(D-ribitylamino)uracil--L-tyrosine 4-hydroxyphenyl transferase CofH [Paraburkholderia antibiotica]